ncbi:MAG: circularly permuted type 2 ATP-grasp protein [Myxococcales bacterium]|nr:circularly permuted type 2 ATP-grasp protein [Myxococcales bacterium]
MRPFAGPFGSERADVSALFPDRGAPISACARERRGTVGDVASAKQAPRRRKDETSTATPTGAGRRPDRGESAPRGKRPRAPVFSGYTPLEGTYDELFADTGRARSGIGPVVRGIDAIGEQELRLRQRLADGAFLQSGITFRVYGDRRGTEKIFPFDVIPRIVGAKEWQVLERGLEQRVRALNLFLADVYGDERVFRARNAPVAEDIVKGSTGYLSAMKGVRPPGPRGADPVYVHVAGIDLVRGPTGDFLVLEDNLRTPSGVSYVLENRLVMKRVFPNLFTKVRVRNVDAYPQKLRDGLRSLAGGDGTLAVLTPGHYNSAYFEHSFLARRMGSMLVQGSDLFVHDDRVYVKTTKGPRRIDVLYRRIDDDFLDPTVFRADSLLGVPGVVRAYAKGNVVLANGLGNGCADDKAVYPFVPELIRYYLGEDPILGQVETYHCSRSDHLSHVLANLEHMVVKEVDASGGYGMLFGPRSTKKERAEFATQLREKPRSYVAQPVVELSTCPTLTKKGIAPRRVDLRPYVVTGKSTWVLPGGLSRVALKEGSYVVNSSQGGGSKDTWVLASDDSVGAAGAVDAAGSIGAPGAVDAAGSVDADGGVGRSSEEVGR